MTERCKPIKGFEGMYSVDDFGNVYSEKKKMFLKPIKNEYLYVSLWKEKCYHNIRIHILVAETFLLKPEGRYQVNHKDGNKWNNCVENLEWVTYSENLLHAYRVLKRKPSSKAKPKKLKVDDVMGILKRKKDGKSNREIASEFKISKATVQMILKGKIWKEAVSNFNKEFGDNICEKKNCKFLKNGLCTYNALGCYVDDEGM